MANVNIVYSSLFTDLVANTASAATRTTSNIGLATNVIDNSSTNYDDVFIQIKVLTGTGTSATGSVSVFAYASLDGGTTYTDNIVPSTAAGSVQTLPNPQNVIQIGLINTPTASSTYVSKLFKIAPAFGGNMPPRWGLFISNNSGGALSATPCTITYMGISYSIV